MNHDTRPSPGAPPNTYVFDTESPEELVRLLLMDRLTTTAMGGPLAGLPASPENAKVIDLACGPGGWALDVAHACPDGEVWGVDISQRMIDYANARASSQRRENAFFRVMDITAPLDFADQSFDLVNGRFLTTVLPTGSWSAFLQECKRLLRPGGIVRLTESEFPGFTNSPACERVSVLGCQLLRATGHGFSLDGRTFGITPLVARLLQKAGFLQIQQRVHLVNFSAGTEAWGEFSHNMELACTLAARRWEKLGFTPRAEDADLLERALGDMRQEEFCGIWWFLSTWGMAPAS